MALIIIIKYSLFARQKYLIVEAIIGDTSESDRIGWALTQGELPENVC